MNRYITFLVRFGCYVVFVLFVAGMGDGAKRSSLAMEPSFAPIEEGVPSLAATIYDESTITEVHDISFFGHTSIGGIRKETDDSTNKLDLGKVKELNIVKSTFESKRFRDREFSLAKVVMANGTLVEDLLIPKHVIICGIDKKSQMERSWFLSKVDKVVIEKGTATVEAPEVVVDKVFKREQEKWEKPAHKKEPEKVETVKVVTEKEVVHVPEPKQPGLSNAAQRLWTAVVDVAGELFRAVKSWF